MGCLQAENSRCEERKLSGEISDADLNMVYLHFVNQNNLGSSPQVKFILGTQQYSAILDTACEASIISENMYRELKAKGVKSLELPTQNVVLIGAFSRKEERVRKQVYLTLNFGEVSIDHVFLVSEQLMASMLIGYDFCIANGLVLDCCKGKIALQMDGKSFELEMMNSREEASAEGDCYKSLNNSEFATQTPPLTDTRQPEMVKLPRSLNPSSSKACTSLAQHDRLRNKENQSTLQVMCSPSDETDVEVYRARKDSEIDDEIEAATTNHSVTDSSKDRVIRMFFHHDRLFGRSFPVCADMHVSFRLPSALETLDSYNRYVLYLYILPLSIFITYTIRE
jgi:hypothetical protein